jgi:hypothetical protein
MIEGKRDPFGSLFLCLNFCRFGSDQFLKENTMQGWKCLVLSFVVSLSACSGKSLLQADCHSCTEEEQRWKDFSFAALNGSWQGSLETHKNDGVKKHKEEKRAELRFVDAKSFLTAKGVNACAELPEESVILNGLLWESGRSVPEFEAFGKAEDGRVAYGRVTIDKDQCRFHRLGRVMGRNRLALPAVQFSQREARSSRAPASMGRENEVSVEFLRFDPSAGKVASSFEKTGRRPAAVEISERPALLIRVYKTASRYSNASEGQWNGTEEYLYRLWKTN